MNTSRDWTAEELIDWFNGEESAAIAAAQRDAKRDMEQSDVTELPFFGPLFPAGDNRLDAVEDVPEWLQAHLDNDLESVQGALANTAEVERDAIWLQADILAGAWLAQPTPTHRAKLIGQFAETLGCSRETARRRMRLGAYYPPDVRIPEFGQDRYLAALQAADPVAVMEAAIRWRWSAAEIKQHIDTGQAPTHTERLLAETLDADMDAEQIAALVHGAVFAAQRDGHPDYGPLLRLRVNVSAVWAASAEEQEAA